MANMKTLTVDGETYTVKDGGAVRFDEAQSLTDDQKAQVRANIGAITEMESYETVYLEFEQGSILGTTGEGYDSDQRVRSGFLIIDGVSEVVSNNSDYSLYGHFYGIDQSYLGNTGGWVASFKISDILASFPSIYYFRIVAKKTDDSNIVPADVVGVYGVTYKKTVIGANSVLYTAQALTEEQKAQARQNIGAESDGTDADYQAEYFTITDDGIVSIKPEYRGACPSNRSDFTYAISDNGLGATGSKNAELPKRLTIPEVVDEIAVTSLAPGMFMCNTEAETIVLPDLVTAIPARFCDMAFGVKQICNTENIESIGQAAFQGVQFEKVKFPNLTSLGTYAFSMCCFLVYVDIGKVTNIPNNTFTHCMKLSRIKGGAGVTAVGVNAFIFTYRLNNVEFLPNLTSIDNYAFVRCRLDHDWSSLSDCTFGTNATALQMNPTDIWSACAVTAIENPVPTLLSQHDPRWVSRAIGTSGITYGNGCVLFTAMHIYCAIHNLSLSSVEEFEDIVNAIDPDILNNYVSSYSYLKTMLEGLGLTVEYHGSGTQAALQAVYDGLAAGKYAAFNLYGPSTSHMAMIYGVKDNKELLFADSSLTPAQYMGRGGETIKYSMPYQNSTLSTDPIWIVSL